MRIRLSTSSAAAVIAALTAPLAVAAQGGGPPPVSAGGPAAAPPTRTGPPVQGAEVDVPLVKLFDRDSNKVLNRAERDAARRHLAGNPQIRPFGWANVGRPRGGITETGAPGRKLTPADVRSYPDSVGLYDASALRTVFIEFADADWEAELQELWHTDVEVPATVIVDGRTYRDVGLSFRGNNSFTGVPPGLKRPLSLTFDLVHDQKLLGHNSLNLLNSNQDASFLRSVLYLDIARQYIPAQQANFVRVVINGESWGVYVNQQTFSKEFLREHFGTAQGTRWKSPNNSVGGGFSYLGDSVSLYRRWYEMKGDDNEAAWRALVNATRILRETSLDQLPAAIEAVMDVDAVLKFLALDVALVNGDGYWRDGCDYNLYLDRRGRFMLVPHDVNESMRSTGRGGVPGSQPEPLTTLNDSTKALRQRLLAVPAYRTRYLQYVGDIAERWLDWERLGPIVARYESLIADDIAADTRKLVSMDAFVSGIHGPRDGSPATATTIRGFADLRRAALLADPDVVAARQAQQAPNPRNKPGREVFLHFFGMEVTWK